MQVSNNSYSVNRNNNIKFTGIPQVKEHCNAIRELCNQPNNDKFVMEIGRKVNILGEELKATIEQTPVKDELRGLQQDVMPIFNDLSSKVKQVGQVKELNWVKPKLKEVQNKYIDIAKDLLNSFNPENFPFKF